MLLFLNFIFSYVYSTFLLYCNFSMFWFLYFTSFQCLFSFMGLFIGLITLFLVPLFILPFFFLVFSFCLINVFGVSFPPLARLKVPFTCEVCSPGWGWTSVL